MAEFGDYLCKSVFHYYKKLLDLVLISNNENDEIYVTSTSELLPGAFCASDFVDDPFE